MTIPAGIATSLRVLLVEAEEHASRRDWASAMATYAQVLEQAPREPYTLVQMSYINSLSGNYRRAEEFALAAASTGTTDPQILGELLPRLRTFNQIPLLLDCIERAKPLSRMSIPLLIAVAAQLSYVNLPERAIEFLDEARRADPDYPTTLLARTQVLTYLGRFGEAEEDVARALRRAPEIAQGYWLQAALRRQTPTANHVDAITRELRRPGRSPEDVALLSFALHKELDDLDRHEEAWSALVNGCRAKRSRLSYHPQGTKQLFEELARFEPTSTSSAPDVSAGPIPIFIVGMHRSGTTLLEQLLDGHPKVKAIGELYDFTSAMRYATDHHCKGVIDAQIVARARQIDLRDAGTRYLNSVGWRVGNEQFFTDKLPSNFLNVGFIAHALLHAKILHMVRDPVETCFSNLRELFSDANPYSYDLNELADYYAWYRGLMSRWHERFPERILDVDYAALVASPEMELRKVAEFCGLPFEAEMLNLSSRQRGVVTASAVQVRNTVQQRDRPKWAPYQRWLAPLIDRLQP